MLRKVLDGFVQLNENTYQFVMARLLNQACAITLA